MQHGLQLRSPHSKGRRKRPSSDPTHCLSLSKYARCDYDYAFGNNHYAIYSIHTHALLIQRVRSTARTTPIRGGQPEIMQIHSHSVKTAETPLVPTVRIFARLGAKTTHPHDVWRLNYKAVRGWVRHDVPFMSPLEVDMRYLVFALAVLVADVCQAQRLLTRGSSERSQSAIDSEAHWHFAKKLSTGLVPMGMKQPTSPGMDPDNMEEGHVGKLDFWSFKVLDVIDDKNVLLSLGSSRIVWLKDFPTKGLVDEQSVRLIGDMECTGTKSYGTAIGGSRTVKVVRFISAEELAKADAEEAARNAERERRDEEASYVTWHSKAGTTIVAKFVSWSLGKVELLTKDGRKLTVPVSSFTDEDAEKLRQLNLAARAKK